MQKTTVSEKKERKRSENQDEHMNKFFEVVFLQEKTS